ncbi:MAG: hypothetical protein U1E50_14940 [Caulobacteraceae bacterium]
MNGLAKILIDLALAGVAVTFLASAAIWLTNEHRKLRAALTRVLKGAPDSMVMAPGRGRAVGYRAQTDEIAVAWDAGGWCLVYKGPELVGAELVIDRAVAAKAFRGEPRKALEQLHGAQGQVLLRLIFDDANHPDFDLELWRSGDEVKGEPVGPEAAIQDANRWLARVEAILRRPNLAAPITRPAPPAPAPPPSPPPAAPPSSPPPPPAKSLDEDESGEFDFGEN